jgi:hypothetical protein
MLQFMADQRDDPVFFRGIQRPRQNDPEVTGLVGGGHERQ